MISALDGESAALVALGRLLAGVADLLETARERRRGSAGAARKLLSYALALLMIAQTRAVRFFTSHVRRPTPDRWRSMVACLCHPPAGWAAP